MYSDGQGYGTWEGKTSHLYSVCLKLHWIRRYHNTLRQCVIPIENEQWAKYDRVISSYIGK